MGVCITEVKGTDAPVAYTVKVDNATNVDYTITDENNNSKTNESLVLTEKNLDVTVKMTPKTGYQWADNKGTETRTVTLTKVTEDKTVTADNVQAVAATQATLTLNLDGAYLNINNKAYWDGDTISADFDSVLTATVVPTSASTAENKVMAKPTITGTKNDVSVAGQTLTIVLGENGELTVAYVYDNHSINIQAGVGLTDWTLGAVPSSEQAGEEFSFELTQKTAAELATGIADVTLTGLDADAYSAAVTVEGKTAKNAAYTTKQYTSVSDFIADVETGKLYTDNQNDEADGTLATVDDYATSTNFYLLTSGCVKAQKAVITVTVTMPNADVNVTAISVN